MVQYIFFSFDRQLWLSGELLPTAPSPARQTNARAFFGPRPLCQQVKPETFSCNYDVLRLYFCLRSRSGGFGGFGVRLLDDEVWIRNWRGLLLVWWQQSSMCLVDERDRTALESAVIVLLLVFSAGLELNLLSGQVVSGILIRMTCLILI